MDVWKIRMISSTDRLNELSLIRVLACVGIVILHTVFAASEYFSGSISSGESLASRMIVNNMMWAVPSFVMVTGVLQLDMKKPLTLGKLYTKYIFRIAVALVGCCLVFRIFDMIMDGEPFTFGGVMIAFSELFTGKAWGHLWYLYLLIGLYVLLPFYRKIVAHCTNGELVYLCGAYFVFVSIIPMIEDFGVPIAFYISESIIYPLYLFLGYMIHEGRIHISRYFALGLLVISTAVILGMDIGKLQMGAAIPEALFGYASPVVIAQTVGVFTLLCAPAAPKALGPAATAEKKMPGTGSKLIALLDRQSFGIYLLHMIFIRLLFRYWGVDPYLTGHGLLLIPIVIGIFLASFILTRLLTLIPGVNKVL